MTAPFEDGAATRAAGRPPSIAPAVGLFGGTFDPIHHGHLRLAVECRERLDLEQLRLIPAGHPSHRQRPFASPAQRLHMVEAAIAGCPGLTADDRELRSARPSYTVETLESLRDELGSTRPLIWIVGLDAFLGLPGWHRWTELLDLAHLAVVHRPGYGFDADASGRLADLLELRQAEQVSELMGAAAGRILFLPVPVLDISSTAIRGGAAAGRSIRYLLPDAVADYISTQQLYR